MNRRDFLSRLVAGAGALAVTPSLLRAEIAASSAGSVAAFNAAQRQYSWLVGWKGVADQRFEPSLAQVEGKIPADLRGVLYRNGPAMFERAGQRYQHWFDGDGLMHAWNISDGGIRHQARLVETFKLQTERRAGRFVIPAAGTTISDPIEIRNNDDTNTANTSVVQIAGKVYALWEAGSAIELDPESLATIGPKAWRDDLTAAPFSAHPIRDRDGTIWNFGLLSMLGGSGLMIWKIKPDGQLDTIQIVEDKQQGYLHSFAMSENHLIFVMAPYAMGEEGSFFERMKFQPNLPCRIAVVSKKALDKPRWFDADFAMAYHFADAFEQGDEIVVRAARHIDLSEARSPRANLMRGKVDAPHPTPPQLVTLTINLRKGDARWRSTGINPIEFPLFDPRARSAKESILYAPTSAGKSDAPFTNAVTAIDLHRERQSVHRYGEKIMAEEHVFVPKPGSTKAGQGWLIGSLLDHGKQCSGIAILDAERVEAGPLATAWLDQVYPLGFHGTFAGQS
ncbi:MAG: carotenoid oxygenase family protein [Dokdonella sp.]